jgi:glyoxylase-like metal-dependent hydrolase (beta-lactamase superfamily II)
MLTEVAHGVLVHRSELLRNNAVVVRGSAGALLVDPGLTDGELRCLARDLRALGVPAVAGFATHPDWDHVLWHQELGDVPRYGTARCAASLDDLLSAPDWQDHAREMLPPEITDEVPLDLFGRVTALPAGTVELPWDGPRVRVVEHPAHSPGHAALLVEDSRVLVAGDMLSDVFVPMLDDGTQDPVGDYLTGLQVLEEAADGVHVVVPGHGSVGSGDVRARIDRDRAYLHALRDGVEPDDPRIGPEAEPGWEWVADIHAGQARSVAQRHRHG